MKDQEQLQSIFRRYLLGELKPKDLDQTLTNFVQEGESDKLKELIATHLKSENEFDKNIDQRIAVVVSNADAKMKEFVHQQTSAPTSPVKRIWRWLPSAVAVLTVSISIGACLYIFKTSDTPESHLTIEEIGLRSDKATLTLADGRTIELSDTQDGIIISDDNIMYNDSSTVISRSIAATSNSSEAKMRVPREPAIFTLTAPKGNKFRITLSDGTKVWLNAGSILKYPSRFIGSERSVRLEGEAYFEVATQLVNKSIKVDKTRDTKSSFIVLSGEQEVKVLGTHFNISAYPDDSDIRTTLVEGSVQVSVLSDAGERSNTRILTPNEQSIVTAGKKDISVRSVSASDYTAWRENLLIFDQKSLRSILLTLSRWYDFQVDIAQIPDVSLSGVIPTNVKFSEVLLLLEETSKVKLKIENTANKGERRVTISK